MSPHYSLKICLALAAILFATSIRAIPPEAEILRTVAEKHFKEKKFEEAALEYQRLIDLYPAEPHRLDSIEKLGSSYIETKNFNKASEALSGYLASDSESLNSVRVRLLMSEAYLGAEKYSEASLAIHEILKRKQTPATPQALEIRALTLLSQAQFGLKQFDEAKLSIERAFEKNGLHQKPSPTLVEKRLTIELALCARLASSKGLTEEQLLDQLDRRGACLFEASIRAKSILKANSTWEIIRKSYGDYADICRNPPETAPAKTEKQLEQFKKEFAAKAVPECAARISKVADSLKSLNKKESESFKKEMRIENESHSSSAQTR